MMQNIQTKKRLTSVALGLLLTTALGSVAAQSDTPMVGDFGGHGIERGAVNGQVGIREYDLPQDPCLTHIERAKVHRTIASNIRRLPPMAPRRAHYRVQFGWPLEAVGSAAEGYGVHALSAYFDNDRAPGSRLDYTCGIHTYDNHAGTDFMTWPFPWIWMDNDEVRVVAAEPGTIVYWADGYFDENCDVGAGTSNMVVIRHLDGSQAKYGHMKSGSLTTKSVGQAVLRGEYLGVVGSSGNSTGVHLHFEVHDGDGNLIDPFAGPCNSTSSRSWWSEQPPYLDSAINRLMTGNAPPSRPPCPQRFLANESSTLSKGVPGFFTAFYRHLLDGQSSVYRLRRPDGSVAGSWLATSSVNWLIYYGYLQWTIPSNAPSGTWTFEVDYEGQTHSKTFQVI